MKFLLINHENRMSLMHQIVRRPVPNSIRFMSHDEVESLRKQSVRFNSLSKEKREQFLEALKKLFPEVHYRISKNNLLIITGLVATNVNEAFYEDLEELCHSNLFVSPYLIHDINGDEVTFDITASLERHKLETLDIEAYFMMGRKIFNRACELLEVHREK